MLAARMSTAQAAATDSVLLPQHGLVCSTKPTHATLDPFASGCSGLASGSANFLLGTAS
jgi:hypothetical protein